MAKPSLQAELEEYLGEGFSSLSEEDKHSLTAIYKKSRKTEVIYLFWFFNFHYAYVGKWWLFLLFILSFGGVAIWWVIDLFRLDTILKEYNRKKAQELLEHFHFNYIQRRASVS